MTVASILLALATTVVVGGVATAWLWLVQRPRLERMEGLKLLAAMRWREFSKLVIDGLHSRGFEPEAVEETAERGQDSVIHLKRDTRNWLLACKQGLNYRITPTVVGDMTDAVRFHGAAGGVVATPGVTDAAARKLASGRIDLFDGESLWPLVHPQLAHSVQDELAGKSRQAVTRQTTIAWAGALTLGLVAAFFGPKGETSPEVAVSAASTPAAPSAPRPAVAPAHAPTIAAAPVSDDEQRDDVIRLVTTLPGVERAMWSTKSTLLIYLADDTSDPVSGICNVMTKYDALRTSRLHLQPPASASRPARFLQCATY
jgi:restriction system protein